MSLQILARRAASVVPRSSVNAAVFVRYNSSSTPSSTSSTPAQQQQPAQSITSESLDKINASQLLGALSAQARGDKTADEDAREWLAAIRELRKDFTQNGTAPFNPLRAFSPDEDAEINLVQQALDASLHDSKFVPTQEQQAQLDRLRDVAIPVKTDPTIQYLTNVIMRHGRKARAQRIMSEALYLVHLSTRRDPVELLKSTLERMSPLLKLRRYTDGGARAEMVPVALSERQRTRHAWNWIVEASDKRNSKSFSVRLANEIIAASNGSGSGFSKREQLHKSGIAARSFIKKL
ncbi:mitochondrial 37S ribosomal protein uS7m [Magnusiomyces paraingens]|uniref:Small ribosomal subunit protein uS7m n=1 Tax=Magnusiomyces paraingens TaxID=2606893 RepID=A0A5E8B2P9_9ASCO|nr:uncharacterized protein SAPINGB_P000767 [Saprochaete ingens]VVT45489.1 unnamed protein product [Saprochaete ingens]